MSNFFFSHNVFYSIRKIVSPFVNMYNIISLSSAEMEEPKTGMCDKGLILIQYFLTMDLCCTGCRARSAYTNVQSDLVLHSSLLYQFLFMNPDPMPFNQMKFMQTSAV